MNKMPIINRRLTPSQRARWFKIVFPNYAGLVIYNNRLYGTWWVGALNRKRTGYYGEYPHTVLEHI